MPVDSAIALSGRPPAIPEFDVPKMFRTLSEMKYLQAEAQALQTKDTAAQADFAEKQRLRDVLARSGSPGGDTLGSLRTGSLPPQAGPEAAGVSPTPGSPAGGPGAAPRRRTTAEWAPELLAAGPSGLEVVKGLLANDQAGLTIEKQALDNDKTALETRQLRMNVVQNALKDVHDQAGLDRAHGIIQHMTGQPTDHLPTVYSVEALQQWQNVGRSVTQEIEQKNKEWELRNKEWELRNTEQSNTSARIQADAAKQDAASRERLAKRPYPMGLGYGQDADAPPPRTVGPSGQATAAPRTPEGQAQYNTFSSEYETASKDFASSTAAFNQTVPLLKDKTNTSDLMALRGFQKLSEPGQAIGVFGGKQTEALGNIMEQITGEISRLTTDKGATIAEPLRQKMAATAKKLHALQIDQHLQIRDDIRAKAKAHGLPPDEIAPNRLTTSGSGGKVISQAKFKEILAAEQAKNKSKTRGEVYLDLAEKGYHVRGGPE